MDDYCFGKLLSLKESKEKIELGILEPYIFSLKCLVYGDDCIGHYCSKQGELGVSTGLRIYGATTEGQRQKIMHAGVKYHSLVVY